jgi:diguanylate cyclase (GGDEF)-like protein
MIAAMNITFALNTVFGSFLVIFLIFADYVRRHSLDTMMYRLFLSILGLTTVALFADFAVIFFEGAPGAAVHALLWAASYIYYVFQVAAFWYILIFCVYTASKNTVLEHRLVRASLAVIAAHAVLLLFNFKHGFYFYITDTNMFERGSQYIIRMVVSYMPAAAAPIAIYKSSRAVRKTLIFLLLLLFLFIGIGTTADILIGWNLFSWPCIAGSLLCSYFFIIRTEAKTDALTGIGNRFAFNEFADKLAHTGAKETWYVMIIDLDHFKAINDVYGHDTGDQALREMAALIKSCTRISDFTARYGGDEFIVAVNGERDFFKFLANLQAALAARNESKKRGYKLEMSYGYDTYVTAGGRMFQDFMEHIDSLMYQSKTERRQGRAARI